MEELFSSPTSKACRNISRVGYEEQVPRADLFPALETIMLHVECIGLEVLVENTKEPLPVNFDSEPGWTTCVGRLSYIVVM